MCASTSACARTAAVVARGCIRTSKIHSKSNKLALRVATWRAPRRARGHSVCEGIWATLQRHCTVWTRQVVLSSSESPAATVNPVVDLETIERPWE